MKNVLPLILSFSVLLLSNSSWAARTVESGETVMGQAHDALAKSNYGRAIALYDLLMKEAKGDASATFTILTSRGIAKALSGQMIEADADLTAAAKAIPIGLDELRKRDPRLVVLVVQIYQWRYLTHLTLKKWNEAVIDMDALRTMGAASTKGGAQADRGKLNILLGQDELGLMQLGEAAKQIPAYKLEYEHAKKALANEDSKAIYLAAITAQLIGSASELKLGFQQSLRAPAPSAAAHKSAG